MWGEAAYFVYCCHDRALLFSSVPRDGWIKVGWNLGAAASMAAFVAEKLSELSIRAIYREF